MSTFTNVQADKVIAYTERHGGGTFWPWGTAADLGKTGGFLVGGIVPSFVFAWGEETPVVRRHIKAFANAHAATFKRNASYYLGTWVDDDNRCHLDVSEQVYSKYQAIVLGLSRGELAIWDVAAGKEIDLLPYRQLLTEAID